jgi:hypothetical protein
MSINRDNLLGKVRALMAKTVDNGCTEEEALAALAKARAMMDAYEISEEELNLTKEEKAVLRSEPAGTRDPHKIKFYLAKAVSEFCECKVWRNSHGGLTFCGLQSDAQFATWLLDSLAVYVQGALVSHLAQSVAAPGDRRGVINGFVIGCTSRIGQRLGELMQQSRVQATGNSRALVVVKSAAVADRMKAEGIHLRSGRSSRASYDHNSYSAGRSAGDGASFGRPIAGKNATLRLA